MALVPLGHCEGGCYPATRPSPYPLYEHRLRPRSRLLPLVIGPRRPHQAEGHGASHGHSRGRHGRSRLDRHRALSRALSASRGPPALLVGEGNSAQLLARARERRLHAAHTQSARSRPSRLDPPDRLRLRDRAHPGVASRVLSIAVNPVTGLLGTLSLFSYVWLYTPLKYKDAEYAMVVGAVPGALPAA